MRYVDPNQSGSKVQFKAQYENFIGGQWVAPVKGEYFDNISPVDGKVFTKIQRSSVEDIELALDAAHNAKAQWSKKRRTENFNRSRGSRGRAAARFIKRFLPLNAGE